MGRSPYFGRDHHLWHTAMQRRSDALCLLQLFPYCRIRFPTSTTMTQFLRFWRRYVPGLIYAAIASVIFLFALHVIDDAATVSVFIGGNGAFPCVLALLLSLGITATFRAIDGRYVFYRGDAVYRGAAASFVVWLMCFTTIL